MEMSWNFKVGRLRSQTRRCEGIGRAQGGEKKKREMWVAGVVPKGLRKFKFSVENWEAVYGME